MAQNSRVTFFFTQGNSGWSETYYTIGDIDLAPALVLGQTLGLARCQLLGQGVTLDYMRASYDDGSRASLVQEGIPLGKASIYNKALSTESDNEIYADFPYSCYLMRGEGGLNGEYRCSKYLSGNPDSEQTTDPALAQPQVVWQTAFKKFVAILTNNVWGFRVQSKDMADGANRKPITGFITAAGTTTVTCAAHGFAIGNKIKLSNVGVIPKENPVNGVYQVATVPDANHFTTVNAASGLQAYNAGGFAQLVFHKVVAFTNLQPVRYTHRKRGKSFGAPVGRVRRHR